MHFSSDAQAVAGCQGRSSRRSYDVTELKLLVTPEEAARRLAISRSRLFHLMASGELESIKVGRSRRIPVKALEEFVDKLRAS